MSDQAKAMVVASFLADSFALGAHWIYDTNQIKEKFGDIDQLLPPVPGSYHAQKQKGDFTHYGDQALVLLKSIAGNNGFDLDKFCSDWQQLFNDYNGYLDSATKTTLNNLADGSSAKNCGSSSTDLGGAARIAPLVYRYHDDKALLNSAVAEQTIMTHNHPATITGAQFIADSTTSILKGASPQEAMTGVLEKGVSDIDLDNRIQAALDSKGENSMDVIQGFGQACSISSALPGAIHLVVTHPDDLSTALRINVMAGGDSAARGMVVGMMLGAWQGTKALPESWTSEMSAYPLITELLG